MTNGEKFVTMLGVIILGSLFIISETSKPEKEQ